MAVITGGGAGIGRQTALEMAEEGAKIVVADYGRDADGKNRADKVADEIKKARGAAVGAYDSVATMAGGQNIINTAIKSFGRVDILVNCAGIFKGVKTVDITEADWDALIGVHMKGHFSCIKAALPEMIKQKSGRIINISSRGASFGTGNISYAAAKAAILGMTSMLADEQRTNNITVNAILPSAVTELFPGGAPRLPDGMPNPPAPDREAGWVSPAIVFLATDEAKDVTGRYIYISGGIFALYARPLLIPGAAPAILHKNGMWTVDDLIEVALPVIKSAPDPITVMGPPPTVGGPKPNTP
ncbi:SDR family NAD(P)-dependent oxidoreductase [Chloroflexota bacterium]